MKVVISFLFIFLIGLVVGKSDRIKMKDVQVLTLKKGAYTAARRSHRVPQLACVGGSARCSFVPETVQCYNRGWDGVTVNWECKADMDKKYSFGQLEVTCEGYDHPDDSYILAGSCGLEFSLNMAAGSYNERVFKPPPYPGQSNSSDDLDLSLQSIFFIIIVFGVLFFIVYIFRSPRNLHEASAPPPPPGFRPDYFSSGYNDYGSGPSCGPSTGTTSGDTPGFGTGFFTGGVLGYLFGRNRNGPGYTRDYSSSRTSYDSGYSRPASETYITPETGGTETKTGYATSKRR